MTIKDMEDHLSIVQVLEKERREWHAERAKLTHCIHLQQVELASRSSAAQETAALIAKEFARVIEGFEERLLKVETDNERVIGELKGMVAELLTKGEEERKKGKGILGIGKGRGRKGEGEGEGEGTKNTMYITNKGKKKMYTEVIMYTLHYHSESSRP